jgi:hypothetical protein
VESADGFEVSRKVDEGATNVEALSREGNNQSTAFDEKRQHKATQPSERRVKKSQNFNARNIDKRADQKE